MNNDICTILVNSCDSYEDTWYPFFTLLKKYWPDCKYPIVLNTESKQYKFPGLNIKSINLDKKYQSKNIAWGKRLKKVLKNINSKYILFMLDDFFITDYVDSKKIDEVIRWMEKDSNIAVFSLYRVVDKEHKDIKSDKYKGFYLRNKKGDYRYNCQAAIWNREELIKALRNFESPWDWELIGNIRSHRSNKEFYTLMNPSDYVFKYDYEKLGIVRGYWMLPYTKELLDKEHIKIDYSIRNNIIKEEPKRDFYSRVKRGLKVRINKLRSRL